jgi:IS30 family transposase
MRDRPTFANGSSVRQIAAALDRSPSTISRELKRNDAEVGYRCGYAQQQTQVRRGLWIASLRWPQSSGDFSYH